MNGTNKTIVSVLHDDKLLFCTDSFPVIPNKGEIISVRNNDSSERYVVTEREFIYQKNSSDRDIFVIIKVDKDNN